VSAKVQMSLDFLEGTKMLLEELRHHHLDKPTRMLCTALERELGVKFEALERRKTFTEYKKTQSGTEKRERNRQAYLDQSEIHKDWRSQKELHSQP